MNVFNTSAVDFVFMFTADHVKDSLRLYADRSTHVKAFSHYSASGVAVAYGPYNPILSLWPWIKNDCSDSAPHWKCAGWKRQSIAQLEEYGRTKEDEAAAD